MSEKKEEIANLQNQLAEEKKNNANLQIKHNEEIIQIQTEQAKILKAHNDWRKKVEDFIPLLWERLKIAEICSKLFRIDNTAIKKILSFTALRIGGKVRNPDNGQAYEITNLKVQMARTTDNPEKLELRLDDVEHTKWLSLKTRERIIANRQRTTEMQNLTAQKKVENRAKMR